MDIDETALLSESLDQIVRDTPSALLDSELAGFGWRELLDESPEVAVPVLFETQGRHLALSSAIDTVLLRAVDIDDTATAVVLPSPGAAEPTSAANLSGATVELDVRGLVTNRYEPPQHVLVPAMLDGHPVLAHARYDYEWPSAGMGIAASSTWTKLRTRLRLDESALRTGSESALQWRDLRAAGHRAMAYELVGVATRMLELATEHVSSRSQFGRPLGAFQAVKHRLADVRLWQESARLAVQAAWEPSGGNDRVVAALFAKSIANQFVCSAREHCQQVLGGMGFTWEHEFHRYLKQALMLEPLLGSSERLYGLLGAEMCGSPPRLAML